MRIAASRGRVAFWFAALLLPAASSSVVAQSREDTAPPRFEAASVKANRSGATGWSGGLNGTTLRLRNTPLWFIIAQAYEVGIRFDGPETSRFKLFVGDHALTALDALQDKVFGARYDIVATVPERVSSATEAAMLRTLLVERFHLQVHTETRQQAAYELRVVRPGKLTASLHDCTASRMASARGETLPELRDADGRPVCGAPPDVDQVTERWAGPLQQLVGHLQQHVDGMIADATGLPGNYQWAVAFPRFALGPNGERDRASISTINDALQDALGLRLVRVTAPVEVFVIDSVAPPTPD